MPYYRRNLYVLTTTVFVAAVCWNQIMPFLSFFVETLNVPKHLVPQWTGIAFAAQCVGSILTQPFWGKLGDSHGRKPMILRAGFCLAGVYLGMSFCRTPLQLTTFRFLNGALTGFIPGSYALIATNTPTDIAPRSIATAQAAANAGLIVGPWLGVEMAKQFGYRGSMQVGALAILVSTLLVWWLVEEPNKTVAEKTSLREDFAISMRSPVQFSLMFVMLLFWAFGAAIGPFLMPHLRALDGGVPERIKSMVFALPAVAFILSCHAWTRMGERKGYERTITLGLIGGAVCALALSLTNSLWLFATGYFMMGLWTAALSPSISAITCTHVAETFRGRAYAIQQAAGTLGGLVAPLAAGYIAGTIGIPWIFVSVGVMLLVGVVLFRRMVKKWKLPGDPLQPEQTG